MQSKKIALAPIHDFKNSKHIVYIDDVGIAMLFERKRRERLRRRRGSLLVRGRRPPAR